MGREDRYECVTTLSVQTYGFSFSTLHTEAIVLKQSVVLSNVRDGFCIIERVPL